MNTSQLKGELPGSFYSDPISNTANELAEQVIATVATARTSYLEGRDLVEQVVEECLNKEYGQLNADDGRKLASDYARERGAQIDERVMEIAGKKIADNLHKETAKMMADKFAEIMIWGRRK
jgi:hypothetical protein